MGGALTLSVDASALASAPAFDASAFSGSVGSDVAQYWSGKGVSIPATGGTAVSTSSVLIQGSLSGLNVVDSSGQQLGQVQDFVVNTQTGELVYAVLTGGSTFGSKYYVVPVKVMTWQNNGQSSSSGGNSMGQLQTTAPSSAFSSAPSVNAVSDLDFSTSGWNSSVDSYWNSVK
jgi:hypothetical protein